MKQHIPTGSDTSERRNSGERGVALLLAIVVAVLLTLIGLSLTSSSLSEFNMSNEFEAHEKALIVADAAFNIARDELRGQDLSTVLATPTAAPKYIPYNEPAEGTYSARNPVAPLEARSINFANPPTPIGSRVARGMLTPAAGNPFGTGRYFAAISDNDDEAELGLPDDRQADSDYTIFMRVVGIHEGSKAQVASDTSGKNSVAILEGLLRRDLSFDLASPLTVYGPDVDADFDGNSFDLIGDADHPAVTVLNNDAAGGDAAATYQSMIDAIGNKGTVVGQNGPDGVPIVDGTEDVRNSNNPDATNVFDPMFLLKMSRYLATVADNHYATDTSLSGSNANLGTVDAPEITVASGNLSLGGSASGAGIMIVNGSLEIGGSYIYDGIILVVGEGHVNMHGANKSIRGGLYTATIEEDEEGNPVFGIPTLEISGNSNFIFNSDNLRMAINILPMKTLSLREITPELEPN